MAFMRNLTSLPVSSHVLSVQGIFAAVAKLQPHAKILGVNLPAPPVEPTLLQLHPSYFFCRWHPSDSSMSHTTLTQLHNSSAQQQQQQPHPYAPTTMAISADASAPANSYTPYSSMRSSAYAPVALPAAAEMQQAPHSAAAAGVVAPSSALVHVHVPFLVLFVYLGGMAACATSPDW
jgi:hypothetical protein